MAARWSSEGLPNRSGSNEVYTQVWRLIMNRSCAAIVAFASLLVGYGLAGARVSASGDDVQKRRLPYVVQRGEHINLTFVSGSLGSGAASIDCIVVDESDMWVRCKSEDAVAANHEQLWYDLTRVVMVKSAQK